MEGIIIESKKFLANSLKDKKINFKFNHPWRSNGIFKFQHSLRVEKYVEQLLNMEYNTISKEERLALRLAAILHDIGSVVSRKNHSAISSEIAYKWLKEQEVDLNLIDRVTFLIAEHSNKENRDRDLSNNILKDADLLDELGIMLIFMTSNRVNKESPFFFQDLSERIKDIEIPYCDEQYELAYTNSAKNIILEKKQFILDFNKQLIEENKGSLNADEFYDLVK